MELQFCNLALRTETAYYDCKKAMQKLVLRMNQTSFNHTPINVEHKQKRDQKILQLRKNYITVVHSPANSTKHYLQKARL